MKSLAAWSFAAVALLGAFLSWYFLYGRPAPVQPFSDPDLKTVPVVSLSASGWNLKPGPPLQGDITTIVINPRGQEFNIGVTAYPDFLPATLWIVEVPQLHARFLIIRVPPAMSASVPMPVLYLDDHDRPTLAATIRQRWEFPPYPHDKPGFDPIASIERTPPLRDLLFEDSDLDGVLELVEDDIWKEGGTVTYYSFTPEKRFKPLWIEEWFWDFSLDRDNCMVMKSRRKAP